MYITESDVTFWLWKRGPRFAPRPVTRWYVGRTALIDVCINGHVGPPYLKWKNNMHNTLASLRHSRQRREGTLRDQLQALLGYREHRANVARLLRALDKSAPFPTLEHT